MVEMLFVLIIIGILSTLALPQMLRSVTKKYQREAKDCLTQVYQKEHQYFDTTGVFLLPGGVASASNTQALASLGLYLTSETKHSYRVIAGDETGPGGFTVVAEAEILPTGRPDWIEINSLGMLVVVLDASDN